MTEEVKVTGEEFIIKFTPTISSNSVYLGLNIPNSDGNAISWLKIPQEIKAGEPISFNLGIFEK